MSLGNNVMIGAIASSVLLLSACGGGSDFIVETPQIATQFASGVNGWAGAVADYSDATAPTEVVWAARALPAPLSGSAYFNGGTNHSDDLFIYNKKKFSGYQPSAKYNLTFEIQIATNQSSGCFGVGGSPGESVFVVVGAAPTEPKTVLVNGDYRVDLDHGNQGEPGKAYSQVLGNIANAVPDCGPKVFQAKTLKSSKPLTVQADASGNLWVFFGIDSGFESRSEVYYQSISAQVTAAQ
jgi:hypothetical protein